VSNPTARYYLGVVALARVDGGSPQMLAVRPLPSEVRRSATNHIEMVCAGGVIAVRIKR